VPGGRADDGGVLLVNTLRAACAIHSCLRRGSGFCSRARSNLNSRSGSMFRIAPKTGTPSPAQFRSPSIEPIMSA
jgi:hypothetical protein